MAKIISIADLEKGNDQDPIWALNTSANSEADQAGEINIGIPKQNGTKIDALFVPQTWLPIELTLQIPRLQLLASSEFRQAINNRLISLIDAVSASKILRQEGAVEEQTRLAELRRHIRQSGAAKTLTSSKSEITMISGGDSETLDNPGAVEGVTSDDGSGLTPGFSMFAEKLSGMDDVNALNAIRSRRRFTLKELQYLKSHLADKPKTLLAVTSQIGKTSK